MKKFIGNKILLSIIIPYHRKKNFFHSTIKSICVQTFKNSTFFEILFLLILLDVTTITFLNLREKLFNK